MLQKFFAIVGVLVVVLVLGALAIIFWIRNNSGMLVYEDRASIALPLAQLSESSNDLKSAETEYKSLIEFANNTKDRNAQADSLKKYAEFLRRHHRETDAAEIDKKIENLP